MKHTRSTFADYLAAFFIWLCLVLMWPGSWLIKGCGSFGSPPPPPTGITDRQGSCAVTASASPITLAMSCAGPAPTVVGNQVIVNVTGRDPGQSNVPLPTISGMGASWLLQADSRTGIDYRSMVFEGTVVTPGTQVLVSWTGGNAPAFSAQAEEFLNLSTVIDGAPSATSAASGTSVFETVTTDAYPTLIIGNCGHNSNEAISAPMSVPFGSPPWDLLSATNGVSPGLAPFWTLALRPTAYSATCSWATSVSNAGALVALKSSAIAGTPPPAGQPGMGAQTFFPVLF